MRKLLFVLAVAALVGVVPIAPAVAAPLIVRDMNHPEAPTFHGLAQTLVGEGVTISGVLASGQLHAIGSFAGGTGIIGPDFESGVILSTGRADSVPGPNTSDQTTTINNSGSDPDLDLLTGFGTRDAAVLEFDFTAEADQVFFQYVFTSEEYNEFVNTQFNDVFGFFVNGVNCATVGDGQPVSINTINNGNPEPGQNPTASNPHLYRNNDLSDAGGTVDTEMDGLTTVLTCEAPVSPGQNHLKLAIADAGDAQLDSNVFIKAGSLSTEDPEPDGTDLAISKTDTPDPVTTGGLVQYTIAVENQGETASGVHVVDTPDSGEVVGTDGGGWTCEVIPGDDIETSSSASCTLDEPLDPGATAPPLMVYVQAPDAAGTITNTATASGGAADPDPDDNTATEETTVQASTTGEGEQQVTTFCPPTGCTFSTGDEPSEDDPTTNVVEVPPGGDGSLTTLHEGSTTFPCGGGSGVGSSALGQETNFVPPTGITDPANPIKVTTTWDVSVWPIHKGNSDPGLSNGERGEGHVKVCMRGMVDDGEGGKTVVEFRVPRCDTVGILAPGPTCWDQVSRNAAGDISIRFLMLSEDPQWRR